MEKNRKKSKGNVIPMSASTKTFLENIAKEIGNTDLFINKIEDSKKVYKNLKSLPF